MRSWYLFVTVIAAIGFVGCRSQAAPTSPTNAATLTGTWVGSASDSSGSTMGMSTGVGMGMAGGSMGDMVWQITQSGTTFTGTVSFSGYRGSGKMQVLGTMNGRTGTFSMTMPMGTMPMAGCGGLANGSIDIDDLMNQMHGSYSGSTTCSGPFNQGQMNLFRR